MKKLFCLLLLFTLSLLNISCKKENANPVAANTDVLESFGLVQGGTFSMGSLSGDADEKPVHAVTISSFYMSKTEVSQSLWKAVMDTNPSYFTENSTNYPVEQVSWYDCLSFCNKLSLKEGKDPCYSVQNNITPSDWKSGTVVCDFNAKGYRVPTEAEWEFAARGGIRSANYTYSGSNNAEEVSWYAGNSYGTTQIVGTKKANEIGLKDMTGNVWEWCWDWYGGYSSTAQSDPAGASSGTTRILRGGAWDGFVNFRNTDRVSGSPGSKSNNLGFRLVCTR